jgi:hypothetical protein
MIRWRPFRGPRWRRRDIAQAVAAAFELDGIGYVNANAFGGAALNGQLGATGFANDQAFGTQSLRAQFNATGYANANDFGRFTFGATPRIYGGGHWPAMPMLKPLWVAPHYLVSRSLINEQRFGEATFGNVVRLRQRKAKQQRQFAMLNAMRLAA